jgi:hypothetical protein
MWRFVILVLVLPLEAQGQVQPYNPYAPQQNIDARWRRALRENAIAWAGEDARTFVEAQEDLAAVALLACSQPVARRLAEFGSKGLAKLPRGAELLRVIVQPGAGDEVALWAIDHASELTDPDSFAAYCSNPLQYALNLKPLAEGTAEVRKQRLAAQTLMPTEEPPAPETPASSQLNGRVLAIIIGGVAIVALLAWRWHKKNQYEF